MKLKLKALLLILTIFLSGCSETVYITKPLPYPEPLVIPADLKVKYEEWGCLAPRIIDPANEAIRRAKCKAFIKLQKRSKLKSARNDTLMGIIKSTHKAQE
jgi:uncharacterized protein YceK